MILQRGVALLILQAPRHAERAERHALVELHVVANDRGLADDYAGAMVDVEAAPDGGARVDVDAGQGVGVLGDDARDERHALQVQRVGDALVAPMIDIAGVMTPSP